MAQSPIGISFIPTADNQAQGPLNMQQDGAAGSDLAEAFKVLSLRLPQVLGARAISSSRLLTSPGSAGMPGAFNPHAAVFEALLNAMTGGLPRTTLDPTSSLSSLTGNPYRSFYGNEGRTSAPTAPTPDASLTRPTPSLIPGSDLPRMPGPSDDGGGAM